MTAPKKGQTPLVDRAKVTNLGRMVMGTGDATYVPVEFAENLERDRARLVAALKGLCDFHDPLTQEKWDCARDLLRDLVEL